METQSNPAGRADRALEDTGRNLRQAQERLARLLAAARLAAAERLRRLGAPVASQPAH